MTVGDSCDPRDDDRFYGNSAANRDCGCPDGYWLACDQDGRNASIGNLSFCLGSPSGGFMFNNNVDRGRLELTCTSYDRDAPVEDILFCVREDLF